MVPRFKKKKKRTTWGSKAKFPQLNRFERGHYRIYGVGFLLKWSSQSETLNFHVAIFFSAKAETDLVEGTQDLVERPTTQLYSSPTSMQVWVLAPHLREGTNLLSHSFLVCKAEKVTPPTNTYWAPSICLTLCWALGTRDELVPVLTGRDKRQPQSVFVRCY